MDLTYCTTIQVSLPLPLTASHALSSLFVSLANKPGAGISAVSQVSAQALGGGGGGERGGGYVTLVNSSLWDVTV